MAIIDTQRNVVVVRIVYEGPPLSGKTTSIHALSNLLGRTTEVFSLAASAGPPLDLDWMEYIGGFFRGYSISCQIISLPGQLPVEACRHFLLRSADAVIFVLDASEENPEIPLIYFKNLRDILAQNVDTPAVKTLIQANKQDKTNVLPVTQWQARFFKDYPEVRVIETTATLAKGIRESFVFAVRFAIDRASELLATGQLAYDKFDLIDKQELLLTLQNMLATDVQKTSAIILKPEPVIEDALSNHHLVNEVVNHEETSVTVVEAETTSHYQTDLATVIIPTVPAPAVNQEEVEEILTIPESVVIMEIIAEEATAVTENSRPMLIEDTPTVLAPAIIPDVVEETLTPLESEVILDVNAEKATATEIPTPTIMATVIAETSPVPTPAVILEEVEETFTRLDDPLLMLDLMAEETAVPEDQIIITTASMEEEELEQADHTIAAAVMTTEIEPWFETNEFEITSVEELEQADHTIAAAIMTTEIEPELETNEFEMTSANDTHSGLSDIQLMEISEALEMPILETPSGPTFAQIDTPRQWLWPPYRGRKILNDFWQQNLFPPILSPEKIWIIQAGQQWRGFSKEEWQYTNAQDSRLAWRTQLLWHLHATPILAEQRAIIVNPQDWRVWQIVANQISLTEQLYQIWQQGIPSQIALETFRAATRYLDILQQASHYPVSLALTLEQWGVTTQGQLVYLGWLEAGYAKKLTVDTATLAEMVKSELAQVIRHTLSAVSLDLTAVIHELKEMEGFEQQYLLEMLVELFANS